MIYKRYTLIHNDIQINIRKIFLKYIEKGEYMSNLILRDINISCLNRIDQLAKKSNQSRNSYLKNAIENMAVHQNILDIDMKYTELCEKVFLVLQANTKSLNQLIESNNIMINTLNKITGG